MFHRGFAFKAFAGLFVLGLVSVLAFSGAALMFGMGRMFQPRTVPYAAPESAPETYGCEYAPLFSPQRHRGFMFGPLLCGLPLFTSLGLFLLIGALFTKRHRHPWRGPDGSMDSPKGKDGSPHAHWARWHGPVPPWWAECHSQPEKASEEKAGDQESRLEDFETPR